MPYDHPYRLEIYDKQTLMGETAVSYAICRTGDGIICEGDNFDEMRKLVDAANERQKERT